MLAKEEKTYTSKYHGVELSCSEVMHKTTDVDMLQHRSFMPVTHKRKRKCKHISICMNVNYSLKESLDIWHIDRWMDSYMYGGSFENQCSYFMPYISIHSTFKHIDLRCNSSGVYIFTYIDTIEHLNASDFRISDVLSNFLIGMIISLHVNLHFAMPNSSRVKLILNFSHTPTFASLSLLLCINIYAIRSGV